VSNLLFVRARAFVFRCNCASEKRERELKFVQVVAFSFGLDEFEVLLLG